MTERENGERVTKRESERKRNRRFLHKHAGKGERGREKALRQQTHDGDRSPRQRSEARRDGDTLGGAELMNTSHLIRINAHTHTHAHTNAN